MTHSAHQDIYGFRSYIVRVMILTTVFIIKAVNVTYNLVINVRIVFYFTVKNLLSMSSYGGKTLLFQPPCYDK